MQYGPATIKERTSRGASQLPRISNDEEQEEMELENQALKASEAVHGGEGWRLEPGVEAATWVGHEDDVVEGPVEASPGSEAAEEAQEPRTNMA